MIHPALSDLYKSQDRKPKELWISEVVYCPRLAYLSYLLPLQKMMNDALLAGVYIHRLIQEHLAKQGYEIEKRIEFDIGDDWKLIGRADACNNEHVIEIKTTSDYSKDPPQHWIDQANLYAYILQVPKFKVLVVNKPNGHYVEHEFDMDENRALEMIEIAKKVKDCIIKRVLPEGRMDWCLRYCQFAVFCKELKSQEVV